MSDLCQLTALQAAAFIREGRVSSRELVEAHLEQIEKCEPEVQAWAFLDRDHALAQADAAQDHINMGRALGPLHGVPIGIKDIIDTGDMPTECGTPVLAGNAPDKDASLVAQLRQAGAIILGKTVTTELAFYTPGKTRNPNNIEHTPGGSSSGSAAAVAAQMVPGAIGTQTNGSIIRPAAFCGVVGYKPSRGLISRHGVLRQAPSLDTIGVMARTVEDVALIAEQIMGYDANDKSLSPRARPDLLAHAQSDPPYQPRFAFVRTPVWDQAEPETPAAFAELIDALGDHVVEMYLPDPFDQVIGWHKVVMEAEIGCNFGAIHKRARNQISPALCETIERGQKIAAVDYLAALETIPKLTESLASGFDWVDAFITPAAPGAAPHGIDATGNPIFCTLWTFTGMPAITLPLLQSSAGLPIGVQLVGQTGRDARLMRTARWLVDFFAKE
jgi:Asp-tRNA(Asn)/Glu-tRNA(Gln) amidotransferase A subunit family amidase